eukprot:731556-Hanusia_phi.AAC.1
MASHRRCPESGWHPGPWARRRARPPDRRVTPGPARSGLSSSSSPRPQYRTVTIDSVTRRRSPRPELQKRANHVRSGAWQPLGLLYYQIRG